MTAIPEGLAAALADRYRLERELGAGGMATVYLAEDLKHHRQVAIKVLRPDLAASLGAERFLREVGIAARLSHPHILGLHDSGETAGFLYYVMPYVEGISLRQKLQREGELPIPEAVRILRDIADALALAHRQGVVHRDIKPENVMLVERNALVMDFGVAKALAEGKEEGSSSLTSAGVALGTPAYMAPEQASGEGHVDARADLYAWGVVAYELLAGQPPFIRATPQNTLAAQVTATPEPVSHHRANVPGTLARLVMQCLEKKAADRPQTAEEVLRQLDQVLTPSGGMTPTDTRPYQTAASRRARRQTLLIGAVVVAGLGVIGLLGWRWWQTRGIPIVADRVVIAPFRNESGKPELADLGWRIAEQSGSMVSREGVTEPVPIGSVRELVGNGATPMGSGLNRLARQTGAGLVVSGTYRTRGDSIEIRGELLRMPTGTKLYDLAPVVGGLAEATVLDRVADQVALALQLNKDWGDKSPWGKESRAPASLAAYRELIKYWDLERRGLDTATNAALDRMLALDSTWPSARLYHLLRLSGAEQDTLVARELKTMAGYLPGDRDELLFNFGHNSPQFRDDYEKWEEETYQILRRQFDRNEIDPPTLLILHAYLTNRWTEAVELGARRHTATFPINRTVGPEFFFEMHKWMARSLHALGRHQEELVLAQEILKEYGPQQASEFLIGANAALGRTEEVERLVLESQGRTGGGDPDAGRLGAIDLRTHGQLDASRRLCGRLADQAMSQPKLADRLPYRIDILNCAGRLEEAIALARQLARSAGETVEGLGYGALYEARAGNRPTALALVERLLAFPKAKWPDWWGIHSWAMMTFAVLGDTTQALQQLREGRRDGELGLLQFWPYHMEPDLDLIRSHPAAIALMRPKE